jgi:ankyrin repeat protein
MSLKFNAFCDHAAKGRLADVQRMLESGELPVSENVNVAVALVRAAENGHVDVVDWLLRYEMFDPSAGNRAIRLAAANGHLAVVERLLLDERVDPSADENDAVRTAAVNGHHAVVERLMQDERVDPSAMFNIAVQWAAKLGHSAVVEQLLRDARVDPSARNNYAVRLAAYYGHLAVVERLLAMTRVDPSADKKPTPCERAAENGHFAIVDRLLEDDRVDVAVAIQCSLPEDRKRFECRERLTEICTALQDLALPAWITVQILDAARPRSTLPLHSKWNLVCAVKHFHDKHPKE